MLHLAQSVVYEQKVPSNKWVFTNPLGRVASVGVVVEIDGKKVGMIPLEIKSVKNDTEIEIHFSAPQVGVARLS